MRELENLKNESSHSVPVPEPRRLKSLKHPDDHADTRSFRYNPSLRPIGFDFV